GDVLHLHLPRCAAQGRLDSRHEDVYTLNMSPFLRAARQIAGECPGMRVREASRLLTRTYDEALRPLGLQMSQLSVLVAVAIFGERGAGIGSLAQVLVMDRTTVTRSVQALRKAGLVSVGRSPADARARVVVLTRAGERAIEAAHPLWMEAQQRLRDSLG